MNPREIEFGEAMQLAPHRIKQVHCESGSWLYCGDGKYGDDHVWGLNLNVSTDGQIESALLMEWLPLGQAPGQGCIARTYLRCDNKMVLISTERT